MLDQLKIGDKSSFDDFGASVSSRSISPPAKKTIKETVPFSNVTYDFSKINGELYWEERTLKYAFEILGDTPADLEQKKSEFANWIMNVFNEEIHDPFEPEHHYVGTYDDMSFADDESVEKTTATVSFTAYPYKIANDVTNYVISVSAESEKQVAVCNSSGHKIVPEVTADNAVTIVQGSTSYVFASGVSKDSIFALERGMNLLTIQNAESTDCIVKISFYCEVF